MVAKPAEETRVAPKEVVIPAPAAVEPDEKIKELAEKLVANLKGKTDDYIKRMAGVEITTEAGTHLWGFPMWDCLSYGPYTASATPGYLPNKVVAFQDTATMYGLIWINPLDYNGIPPRYIFANRPYNARFETINLTTGVPGPSSLISGVFPDADKFPPSNIFWLTWQANFQDPGVTPNLYELNLTIDLTQGGLPYAAFSTWHFDPDLEPPFLGLPGHGPEWQFERSARFLVYRR